MATDECNASPDRFDVMMEQAFAFAASYKAARGRLPIIMHTECYALMGQPVRIVGSSDCDDDIACVTVAGPFDELATVALSELSLRRPRLRA